MSLGVLKTTLITTTLAAATLGLTGCSIKQPDLSATDITYLAELADGDIDVTDPSEAVAAGRAVCSDLDKRTTLPATVRNRSANLTAQEASVLAVAAINTYCPQHVPLLRPTR